MPTCVPTPGNDSTSAENRVQKGRKHLAKDHLDIHGQNFDDRTFWFVAHNPPPKKNAQDVQLKVPDPPTSSRTDVTNTPQHSNTTYPPGSQNPHLVTK